MKYPRFLALLLAAILLFSLCACTGGSAQGSPAQSGQPSQSVQQPSQGVQPSQSTQPEQSSQPSNDPACAPSSAPAARLVVLNGPTGVGAAKLLSDIDAGTTAGSYAYEIAAANDEAAAMLTGPAPEADIAAMASNVALNLYNKTDGGVTVIALGTLGVLHILESGGGTEIQSMADLAGRTILAPGQGANPEYALRYLLSQNGLDPDQDVTLEFYTDASEISAKLLTGDAQCAMLPVPAATAAVIKSQGSVRAALDLTQEWDALGAGSRFIMTAVVVRTAFLAEYPETVDQFLTEYAASIDYVNSNVENAAQLVAGYGLAPSSAIAQKAIPDCHLVCITGSDMQPAIDGYYSVLYQANPASVGGSLPDDAFYYVP